MTPPIKEHAGETMSTKERGVLFNDQMVKALLAGRKWQTRRMVKLDADGCYDTVTAEAIARVPHTAETILRDIHCPYPVGTRMWVKETLFTNGEPLRSESLAWCHAATVRDPVLTARMMKKVASIHCPRGCSRITLEVTAVRVQRLQDISEEDAIAEGIVLPVSQYGNPLIDMGEHTPLQFVDDTITGEARLRAAWTHRMHFASLWESINGKGSWEANQWVWAYSLGQVKP
jgi:hypothetical protein